MMTWGQLNLQDANSPLMEELIFFLHDFICMILVFIISFVGYCMISTGLNKFTTKNLLESQMIEGIWTIIPAMVLVQIAMPSLLLLYMLDESIDSTFSVKILAHQWYWSYEYSDFWAGPSEKIVEFDSYMVPSMDLQLNMFRLLDVDNRMLVPFNTHIRLLITSADVLHAWTVPSLGVKVDAVPGRMNMLRLMVQRPGVMFGQCSEICGANHSFMPIVLESVNMSLFLNWAFCTQ